MPKSYTTWACVNINRDQIELAQWEAKRRRFQTQNPGIAVPAMPAPLAEVRSAGSISSPLILLVIC